MFFRHSTLSERFELSDSVPRQLGQQAAAGEILAGLLPLVDFLRLQDTFERIGHFGIAVRRRAGSTLLFSRKPIRQLDGATIAVTEESSTTVCLLRLLLEQRYEITPAVYDRVRVPPPGAGVGEGIPTPKVEGRRDLAADADALLLIGDEALRFQHSNTSYPYELDVAFEWWLWQHLPFVFAVWAIRKDASAQDKRQIELGLAKSLGVNLTQLEFIAQDSSKTLGLPASELETYLSSFIYRLGRSEEEGIRRFKELLDGANLL